MLEILNKIYRIGFFIVYCITQVAISVLTFFGFVYIFNQWQMTPSFGLFIIGISCLAAALLVLSQTLGEIGRMKKWAGLGKTKSLSQDKIS